MSLNYTSLLVVIPTRNRAELAVNAINSVLSQENCELEIIVSDNSTDEAEVSRLEEYCHRSDDKRLRYIRPPKPLPMTKHWNWAIGQALQISESNHITYLTDRLLFAKNCLQNLQNILTKYPDKIVSYAFDSIEDSEFPVSLSQIRYTGKLFEIESASILKIYAEMERIQALPRMLNSVASRQLMTKIFEKYGNYFFSVSPDYNFAFRSLDLEESILYYDRPLLISYGNNRSNGWNVLQGNFNRDALDFINNLSSTEICFDSPVKAIWVLPNAIIHEYCYAKPFAVSDKFPEINQNKYLLSLVENVVSYKNEKMREEMLNKLRAKLGSDLVKYRAQAAIERKLKGLKVRLHNLANASTPYLLKHNFENVEDAINYATDSRRKPVSDFKLIEDRTGAKPSEQGAVKVLKDFSEV
jgi:glycosyltransferase involved in cell wall biosynthesis